MTSQAEVDAFLAPARPEPKIVNKQYEIQGELFTRATTFKDAIGDKFLLHLWEKRMVALGLAARPDLYALAASFTADDKKKLNDLCKQAQEAARASSGANLGTALHTFTERVDRGETLSIPAPYDADIAAYTAALEAAGVEIIPELIEGVVVNRTLGVAGRFDRIVKVRGVDGIVVADLKTGGFLNWQEFAVQQSIYANAEEMYDPATDTCSPMPDGINKDIALIIHLPVGRATCTIHTVDIRGGWEMAQVCKVVRDWNKRSDLHSTLAERIVAPSSNDERRAAVRRHLEHIRDFSDVALKDVSKRWPQEVPTFKASETHTDAELDAIEAVLVEVGKRHQVSFPPAPEQGEWQGINTEAKTAPAQPAYVERSVVDDLIEWLTSLPADAIAAVEASLAGRVPNLKTYRVEEHQAHLLTMHLAIASSGKVDLLDPDLLKAFLTYCRVADHDAPTAEEVDFVWGTAGRLEHDLFFTIDADGWHVVERPAS